MTEAAASPVEATATPDPDAVIVGAGLIGTLQAIALADSGLRVVVVERSDPGRMTGEAFDGRTTAIALATQRIYEALGIWPAVARHASPIRDIRISDAASDGRPSPLHLHFDHRAAASDGRGTDPMGWIVENRILRRALLARLRELPGIELAAPMEIAGVERGAHRVELQLGNGRRIATPLLISCEGRGGSLRQQAGLATLSRRYPQVAIVCTIRHERPHEGVAHEKFMPGGPFAILPLVDDEEGAHRSSIVWTETPAIAEAVMALGAADFAAELRRRVGGHLGAIELVGPRFVHPLGLHHAGNYIDRRLALVGDAAHGIHPIAGQGYNLGARDAAALAEVVVQARRLGLDHGAADVLERYQRWRRFDNTTLVASTDVLNWLFSNNVAPVRALRDVGLAMVGRIAPLKRMFMRHAMGVLGDLPRLARGERL